MSTVLLQPTNDVCYLLCRGSLFNAGYCLENGIGTATDVSRAAALYRTAALKFGHFDAVRTLGAMHWTGKGVARSAHEAMK